MSEKPAEKSDGDGKNLSVAKVKPAPTSAEWTFFRRLVLLVLLLAGIQIFAGVVLNGNEIDLTNVERPERSFETIFGHAAAKKRVRGYLDLIKREKYVDLPWFLMTGPRGTGKRSFAKACASEINGALISVKVSAIHQDPNLLKSTLNPIKEGLWRKTPLVIFMDVGRGLPEEEPDEFSILFGVSHQKKPKEDVSAKENLEKTLLKILSEIGYLEKGSSTPIVTIISSDTPVAPRQSLFEERRVVKLGFRFPTTKEREGILNELLGDVENKKEMAEVFANNTHGLNGGHLSRICKEAKMKAEGGLVTVEDLEDAAEDLEEDEEVKRLLPWERQVVAFHEAGHVVTAWQSEDSDDVTEVSIVPGEDGALGCTKYASAGKLLHTDDMLAVKMIVALAGQLAEKAFFGGLTTGGRDDLYKLTKIAYMRVANFGMEDGFKASYGGQAAFTRTYGERVTEAIDARVFEIIDRITKKSEDLVKQHLTTIGKVAKTLLEEDLLEHEDIAAIIGPRPSGHKEKRDWPCKLQEAVFHQVPNVKALEAV